jgi:hypothetical protein
VAGRSFSHDASRPRLESGMGQCNATNRTLPRVADESTARISRTCTKAEEEPPSHPTLRGLDLIKSCAKFYGNGVGTATPTMRLSHPLDATSNQPAITQVSLSRHSKPNISTVAVTCLSLLLLSILGIATLMWWGFVGEQAKEPGLTVGNTSASAAQSPAPTISALLNLKSAPAIRALPNLETATAPKTTSNNQTDIIIHKVKTQPITVDGEEGPENR